MIFSCSQPLVTLVIGDDKINQCPLLSKNSTILSSSIQAAKFNVNLLFYTLMILCLITNFFDGSTIAFADAGVMQKINTSKKKHDFGRQRLFVAFSFACGGLFSIDVIEIFPSITINCYTGAFLVYFLI